MLETLETYLVAPPPSENPIEHINPDIHVLESDETYGKVSVEPLQRGFGLTIGNPLRRILLSSTNGSAITWIKIEDVVHEYTVIPGVKEEVMELLLNIKRIRIRSQSNRAGKMRLEVTGEGRICAGDIATSSDFEIVNPELHLATLDANDSQLSIEFNVEQGVGYQPAIQSDGTDGMPMGVLPVDAIFSPVRKVNYNIERTRVGQVTDYERLVLEVWTDGTIKPVDAVKEAAENLVNHFFLFSNINRTAEIGVDRPSLSVSPEIYQTPIDRLDLSPRTLNCLKRAHLTKVGEILELSDEELLTIRNFGEKSLTELRDKLSERGIATNRADGMEADLPSTIVEATAALEDLSPEDIGELLGGGGATMIAEAEGKPESSENDKDDDDEEDEEEDL